MTITRMINGESVEISLTDEEIAQIFEAVYANDSGEWFGKVRWCNDDLEQALEEDGFSVTENNVDELRTMCESHSFVDQMISAGWDYIHFAIGTLDDEDKLDAGDEEESDEEWGASEWCPYCEEENFYPCWDAEKKGYVAICKGCGKEIFLCDACMHADDNPGGKCDWHATAQGGECLRGKTTDSVHQ